MTRLQKFKLILDESCEVRKFFPLLNSFHNLKHIAADYNKSGISDREVLLLSQKEKGLVITYNFRDFAPLLKDNRSGIIGVSHNLPTHQIDKKIRSLLRKKKPSELYGVVTVITGETEI